MLIAVETHTILVGKLGHTVQCQTAYCVSLNKLMTKNLLVQNLQLQREL